MAKLSSYTIDRDFGFAPNPFWNFCTLATCKPNIRGFAEVGDFIIGFGGSRTLKSGKLIYVMCVEEIMTFEQYWADDRFQIKKPNVYGSLKAQYGDNIYHKDSKGAWIQENSHHGHGNGDSKNSNLKNDTKYDRVLISKNEWWYFGDQAVDIPLGFERFIHKRNHKNFYLEDLSLFIDWIKNKYTTKGRLGIPNEWAFVKNKNKITRKNKNEK